MPRWSCCRTSTEQRSPSSTTTGASRRRRRPALCPPGRNEKRLHETIETLREDLTTGSNGVPEPGQAPAVRTSDLSRDDRYPAYGAAAAEAAVRAQAAVVLFETLRARGLLNLYSLRS